MPSWLVELIGQHAIKQPPSGHFELPPKIKDGTRNDTLYRLARSSRKRDQSFAATLAAVEIENSDRCEPPLASDEVQKIVTNAYQQADRADFKAPGATVLPGAKPSANPAVFKNAPTVPEFLAQSDGADGAFYAHGLLVRSGASLLASPRGLGKTIVAMKLAIAAANGGDFCGEVLPKSRVLYCAYENSPALLRDRLRRLGGAESENLRILTRSKAPKLQSEEWRAFPVEDYDFIIIDSLSPALEGGIDERQGGQKSDALAALLDIVQRGPGALLIANTTKTASSIRGSGILTDRADLVFEVRDATDFKPNPKHEAWWDGLVENQGESGWAGRAKRRRGKTIFRLALIASKTRVGPELDPRVLELSLPEPADEPWTVTEVTADVVGAQERSKAEAAKKFQAREDAAVAALKAALPIPKSEAVELLKQNGISRNVARRIIDDHGGIHWILAGAGNKAGSYILTPVDGKNGALTKPYADRAFKQSIPAAIGAEARQESMFEKASAKGLRIRQIPAATPRIYPPAGPTARILKASRTWKIERSGNSCANTPVWC
jgi:hypothetical protein